MLTLIISLRRKCRTLKVSIRLMCQSYLQLKFDNYNIRIFLIRWTIGPKGADFRQVRRLILGGPILSQTFCCCFVCNGFAKHVQWLLISCLTDCLCNLGSKYNGRICPGFINSISSKQSYPQSFCNIIIDWWVLGESL